MSNIIKIGEGGLVGFLHRQGESPEMPQPFERDIFLFDTYVAGTTYIEGMDELEPQLQIGDRLEFIREPDNAYDSKAIAVQKADGIKIGYVPRRDNAVFSRLMDAGKLLFGKITFKEINGEWVKINMDIFLHD